MNASSTTAAPFWSKFHPSQDLPARPPIPRRPITSPTLPTPPVPPKDSPSKEFKVPCAPRMTTTTDHRWSEIVPPSTALTFAAIWDPEEGLVTFSNASLSASESNGASVSPEDADARSQVLTVDFLNLGSAPSTAKESTLFPYSQSRFAASELSTPRFPVSPTRRSSVGTGMALDTSVCPEVEKQMMKNSQRVRDSQSHYRSASTFDVEKPLPPRGRHHHSSSHDSTASNTLSAFGSTLCNAIRRVASPRQGHSRAERYAFLRRSSVKAGPYDAHEEKTRPRGDGFNSAPKSPGLRSIFARSIWLRSGIGSDRDAGLVCRTRVEDDGDGITLDSGFDCLDDDSAYGTWPGERGLGPEDLDAALQRDVTQLKSTFSWTTTSTSRYIDVADYFENDSDTDSTVSSLGAPIASTAPPFRSQCSNSGSAQAQEGDCESPWLPIDPPTPRPALAISQHAKPQRNLLRKLSRSLVTSPPPPVMPSCSSDGVACNRQQYRICQQCHLRIECVDLEAEEDIVLSQKGKGRANSQPDLPECVRNTVGYGRPAAVRSSSTPASLSFSHHQRTLSLPGSRAATPAEVLARASYNHEWASPIPSQRRISHTRSPSAPQPGSSPSTTTMSMRRSTTPTPTMRMCNHFANDMRDVFRGLQTGIRPSTPIPGMPPVPPKNRPPPTSFRPVSAGGTRDRSHSGRPSFSSVSCSPDSGSQLGRSQSHRVSPPQPSLKMCLRSRSLESLRGTAHALASVSAAPLRTLWRAGSFIRHSRSDQPRRSPNSNDDEDGVWLCVDIKATPSRANLAASSEGTIAGP